MDNNRTQHFSGLKEELDVHMILERVYEAHCRRKDIILSTRW